MEKKDFIKLINLIVDTKLKELLPALVKKEVESYLQSGIQPSASDFNKDTTLKDLIPDLIPQSSIIRDGSVKEGKIFSKDPIINKILNETAKEFRPIPKDPEISGDYRAMLTGEYENIENEFTFNSKNIGDVVNRTPSPIRKSTNELKQEVVNSGAPPEIAKAMIKDYRGLLKKQDELKKAGKIRTAISSTDHGIGESW